jgi:lysophospholipase L1-like esterase
MGENIILGGFVALPVLLFLSVRGLFRRQKRFRNQGSWRMLALGNLLVFLLLISIVLLGGEVYNRFFVDTTDAFGLSKTTARWFERHFALNGQGFRDSVDYRLEIQPGLRRVTFLGDSFTAGHGVPDVEDRFGNRIRAKQLVGEVHVVSECGFDTGHEIDALDFLNEYDYEFDVVVLVYCLNDISDIVPQWQETLDRVYEVPSPGFLVEESYFLNRLYARWRAAANPVVADYYGHITDAYSGAEWVEQTRRLRLMHQKVKEQGGRFLVVTFPFLHDLGPDYRYGFIHDQLDQFWKDEGVPHLDLLDLYEPHEAESLVVNAHDPHPNEKAHALAADAIAEFLEAHLAESAAMSGTSDSIEPSADARLPGTPSPSP